MHIFQKLCGFQTATKVKGRERLKIESSSCSDTTGSVVDFGFGFNNKFFSDRVLQIEVIADSSDSEGICFPNRKWGRKDSDKENVLEVKRLHISSLILAAKSPFFHKLFENGMRETNQRAVTLRINASEDAAFMDILKFIYNNTLSETSPDLLHVLMVADKFEVTSCMRYCSEELKKRPMSLESAILYLNHSESVLMVEAVQPLIDAAKKYLVANYSDFKKSQKEVMDFPLCALEVFLSGNGLQVDSEDDVFDFVLEWASTHYPNLEERREVITRLLARCICFSCLSCSKLKEVLASPDVCNEQVSKLVTDALFFKVDKHDLKDLANAKCNSLGRIYKLQPFKVFQYFDLPQPRCVVFFDLKKEECENLFTSIVLQTPPIRLGGRCFYLQARFYNDGKQNSFGLFLRMTKESESCTIDYEYAVIKKSSNKIQFQTKRKGNFSNSNLLAGIGYGDFLGLSWTDFMSKDSEYFINDVLHLCADLTVNNAPA